MSGMEYKENTLPCPNYLSKKGRPKQAKQHFSPGHVDELRRESKQ